MEIYVLLLLGFEADQHKVTAWKLRKSVICLQWRVHLFGIVFWKESALPRWRAMDRHWNKRMSCSMTL